VTGETIRLVCALGIIGLEVVAMINHVDGAALAAAIGALGALGGYQHAQNVQAQKIAAAKAGPKV
jgi:hypothetical protein